MIIYRYLAKEISATLIAISVILLMIFLSNQLIHYMHIAVGGSITTHIILLLLLLKMPVLLGALLPLSMFLGVLMVYGRMYADNEMVVLFASGVSRARILRMTLSFGFMVAILVAILSMWVAPHLDKYSDTLLSRGAISPLELVQPGRFQSFKDGQWVFYVEQISRDHKKLHNIFVAEQPSGDVQHRGKGLGILSAEQGEQYSDRKTGDSFLVFTNGHRYLGNAGEKKYQVVDFSKYGARISQSTNPKISKANAIPTSVLWQQHRSGAAAAELEWRISLPLMALILAMMAVPLSRVKSRQGRYVQLVPAMLLYIIYGNFLLIGRDWVHFGKVPRYIGIWWVHALMLAIGIVLLLNQVGWTRLKQYLVNK